MPACGGGSHASRIGAGTTLVPGLAAAHDRWHAIRKLRHLTVLDPLRSRHRASRAAFDKGFTHYDKPPPAEFGDIEELRAADRFRFANVLRAWIEVDERAGSRPADTTAAG